MKYDISIRVTFPEEVASVLREEKQRFISRYGSCYTSEPHITLFLDSFTAEGYPIILKLLRQLQTKPFVISLLEPIVKAENSRHRNLYIMDVSHKESLRQLRNMILNIANPYRSPFIREKSKKELERRGIHTDGSRESLIVYQIPEEPFDPHITLGEINFDKPQADITETRRNLLSIEGKELTISSITVFWYGKEDGAEKASLLEEVVIPFSSKPDNMKHS